MDITGVKFFQAVQNGDEEEHGCGGLAQVVVVESKVVLGQRLYGARFFLGRCNLTVMQGGGGLVQSGGGMFKGCKVLKVGFCMVGAGCCTWY